jgi:hypothetical protein
MAAFSVATAWGPIPWRRAKSASVIFARSVIRRIPALASARRAGLASLGKSISDGFGLGDFIVPRVQPAVVRQPPATIKEQIAQYKN